MLLYLVSSLDFMNNNNNNNNNNNLICIAPVCAKKDFSGAGGPD